MEYPHNFKDDIKALQKQNTSVFNPIHNFSNLREWALEQSKKYSWDEVDKFLGTYQSTKSTKSATILSATKPSRYKRKIKNRARNKIAKATKKRNRK